MFRKRWGIWLSVFLAIFALGAAWYFLLPVTQPANRGFVRGLTGAVASLWLIAGLWSWFPSVIGRRASAILGGTAAVVCFTGAGLILFTSKGAFQPRATLLPHGLAAIDFEPLAIALAGAWVMGVAFFLGLQLLRAAFVGSHPITGIARTLIDEAIRMKIALVFIALLLFLVPLLPSAGDSQERLSYRIQSFISYSLTAITILLALMTVFLSCTTICTEIAKRQIFLTMTKPISRGGYLFGKWLGIAGLNLLLVVISGLGVWVFAQAMERQKSLDNYDRFAIRSQVLVARDRIPPSPVNPEEKREIFNRRLKEFAAENPALMNAGYPPESIKSLETQVNNLWHTIAANSERTYRFVGADRAREYTKAVQLRVRARCNPGSPDNMVPLFLSLGGRPFNVDPATMRQMPVMVTHNQTFVVDLPIEAVDDNGNLDITVGNYNPVDPNERSPFDTISLMAGDGFELLYPVGTFESNLVRSLAIIWILLSFLSIVGLMAGTFLGFPIAVMLSIVVFMGTIFSGYLVESLRVFGNATVKINENDTLYGWTFEIFWLKLVEGSFWECAKMIIRAFSVVVVTVTPKYGELDPIPYITDGLMVSNLMVRDAALKIGLVCGGIASLIAWLIFRVRELARVFV